MSCWAREGYGGGWRERERERRGGGETQIARAHGVVTSVGCTACCFYGIGFNDGVEGGIKSDEVVVEG